MLEQFGGVSALALLVIYLWQSLQASQHMRKSVTCGEIVTQTCELANVHYTIIAVGNAVRCLYALPTASLWGGNYYCPICQLMY